MQPNQITVMDAWPSTMFLCQWSEYEARAPGLKALVRAQAATFKRNIESGIAGSAKPAEGLVESPLQFFNSSDDPDLKALVGWIRTTIVAVVGKMNNNAVPVERLNVRFNESWFHITNDGGFHDAHTHGNCSWCGIFYLEPGEAAEVLADGADTAPNGVNRFYAPFSGGGILRDYGNAYLGRSYVDVQPMAGRMVVFPAFLLHSALPYRGATDRIIISFNSQTNVVRT